MVLERQQKQFLNLMPQKRYMPHEELVQRISNYPRLKEQFAAILDIAENRHDQAQTADEAEKLAVDAADSYPNSFKGSFDGKILQEPRMA